jgi:hypothetical protein
LLLRGHQQEFLLGFGEYRFSRAPGQFHLASAKINCSPTFR